MNWIKLRKLIVFPNASAMDLPDRGRQWEVLTQPSGTFEHAVFYLQGVATKEAVDILVKEVLPVIRRNLHSPERYLSETAP
jgi:hypothetical protein